MFEGEEGAMRAFAKMTEAVVNEAGKNDKLRERFIALAKEAEKRNVL